MFSIPSSRTVRHIRATAYGFAVFFRLGWGFIVALNAFSSTTRVEGSHMIVTLFLFAANALAGLITLIVASAEAWFPRIAAFTSQIGFEIGWIATFLVLETVGGVILTILYPGFKCEVSQPRSRGNDEVIGPVVTLGDLAKRALERGNAVSPSTCRLSNLLTLIWIWVIVGLTVIYLLYFILLVRSASRRDPRVWKKEVKKFDWSSTTSPLSPPIDPFTLARPGNPHMMESGLSSMVSVVPRSRPTFINPFSNSHEQIIQSTPATPAAPNWGGPKFDRHQIMAHYTENGPYPSISSHSTPWSSGTSYPSVDTTVHSHYDARQMAAMRLEGRALHMNHDQEDKLKQNVFVPPPAPFVPPPIPPTPISPRTQRNVAHESIGRLAMGESTSFQSVSTLGSHYSDNNLPYEQPAIAENETSRDPDGIPRPLLAPLHLGFYSESPTQVRERMPVRSVVAPHTYPAIEQSPNRESKRISVHTKSPHRKPVPRASVANPSSHHGDFEGRNGGRTLIGPNYRSTPELGTPISRIPAPPMKPRASFIYHARGSSTGNVPPTLRHHHSYHAPSRSTSDIPPPVPITFNVPRPPMHEPPSPSPAGAMQARVPMSLRPATSVHTQTSRHPRHTHKHSQTWPVPGPMSMTPGLPPPPRHTRSAHSISQNSTTSSRPSTRDGRRVMPDDMPFGTPLTGSEMSTSYGTTNFLINESWDELDAADRVRREREDAAKASARPGKLRKSHPNARALY